ncbi:DUF2239 family protein [Dyella sp. ASV21]|jgi:hypothetical protein|uniref:DUF2239 family protein n=1 Tax=Dyella sp. ASV21 TaxID=2795114 RepID=UPI0018ED4D48|nr:DUF2239 family protein [Dyella sp. ASV21]
MQRKDRPTCTAFLGHRQLASGSLAEVALAARKALLDDAAAPVLIFDDLSGRTLDLDLRGTLDEVLARLADYTPCEQAPARGPGRPKLGVVPREVTLLPRHWEWLAAQPGGASATLRRLVEEARRESVGRDRARLAGEALDRFMLTMAGDLPGYEEAARAFWRQERDRFGELIQRWPIDVRTHLHRLADQAWQEHELVG